MKPSPDQTQHVRAKGGRASGGTRYYSGKHKGEDRMVEFMQKAIDERDIQQTTEITTNDLSVDELIAVLEFSCEQTERFIREVERRCSQNKT